MSGVLKRNNCNGFAGFLCLCAWRVACRSQSSNFQTSPHFQALCISLPLGSTSHYTPIFVMSMKAIAFRAPGEEEVLEVVELPIPVTGADDVLVRVLGFAISHVRTLASAAV